MNRRGRSRIRYRKYYTVKEWKKFDKVIGRDSRGEPVTAQEFLCNTYDVYLTDYKTRMEKVMIFLKKFNSKNLDATLKRMDSVMDSISKGIDEFGKEARKFEVDARKDKRDYGVLIGKNEKRDYSFLTGKK